MNLFKRCGKRLIKLFTPLIHLQIPTTSTGNHPPNPLTPDRLFYNQYMATKKKCTQAEKKRRIEEIADMIIAGYSQRHLIKHVRSAWGLSDDSATLYIRSARDLVKSDLHDVERADLLAATIQQLQEMARKSAAQGRENNAIGSLRLLSELVGLAPDKK